MTQFGKHDGPKTFGRRQTPLRAQPRGDSSGRSSGPRAGQPQLSAEAQSFMKSYRSQSSGHQGASRTQPGGLPYTTGNASSNDGYHGDKPVAWRRLVSYLIDTFIIALPLNLVFGGMMAIDSAAHMADPEAATLKFVVGMLQFAVLQACVRAAYSIGMEHKFQATLGKMALGIVVTDMQKSKPTLGAVIARNTFGRLCSNIIPLGIGYIMGLFNANKKMMHDLIAGTMVCTKATSATVNQTAAVFA